MAFIYGFDCSQIFSTSECSSPIAKLKNKIGADFLVMKDMNLSNAFLNAPEYLHKKITITRIGEIKFKKNEDVDSRGKDLWKFFIK